ncbi:MAG: methyl-accepting chemotaxis protein [Treponema sp.]|jgi:methyl-accepting chemotaxis protein|nr:methyl-accepting chemotaxis protein [Treponema sp.]
MTSLIEERITRDERDGEVIINYFRLALGVIYVVGMIAISILRGRSGMGYTPWRTHAGTTFFLVYGIFMLFYLRRRSLVSPYLKYVCVVLDMTIISVIVFFSGTYPEIYPPISFLSIHAMLYTVLIVLGSFRYDSRCAIFSGIFAALTYFAAIVSHVDVIDVPYTALIQGREIAVRFPMYNEVFRLLGMIIAGAITGMACKRHLNLFKSMIDSESQAARTSERTVAQTREMSRAIQQSTDEIFLSSKDIYSTANGQASSVQEIESTITENAQIAGDIAEKTGSVAAIASRMKDDVTRGFSVLENNVIQMGDIKNKNDSVIGGIISLGNKIARIRDIIRTINTITDQTKVIAFNAALEAAGAGDRGKRFSVVASEVNRLADDIAALTRQIKDHIEEIQDSSSSLIISSEESADKIAEGLKLVRDLEAIFREILSGADITANQAQTITVSTQRQRHSIEQINIAIADISRGLNSFIHSTQNASASAEGLMGLARDLEAVLNTGGDAAPVRPSGESQAD